MVDQNSKGLKGFWSRLPSGPKMLVMLTLALLPLGVIAIAASIYSARENSEQRAEQTLGRLEGKAERLNQLIARSADAMRAASAAVAASPPEGLVCQRLIARVTSLQRTPGRFALFGPDGALRCASAGFAPTPVALPAENSVALAISPDGQALRLFLYSETRRVEGVAEFSREALADLTFIPGTRSDFDLELTGRGGSMELRRGFRRMPLTATLTDEAPIADGRLALRITLGAVPVRFLDMLLILLPVMMWLAAGLIGWWVVRRQILAPLSRIQRVVSNYKPGDRPIELPRLHSPAREIGELGAAFDEVTRTVARHEAELEAAVERQTKLVREVHHRVKNNLQVVASLLNLHSRGSPSEEVAAAYASIQRRVDALAVVHRNHYAELEENRGVALKALISELAANLRATAPASASATQISIDVEPLYSTQDTAVSVAFLVTEIVEFAMLRSAQLVTIILEDEENGSARFAIEVDCLGGGPEMSSAATERFERIITGLARQLRSALEHDPATGRYAVRIGIVGRREP